MGPIKNTKRKAWFDSKCMNAIESRNKARLTMIQASKILHRCSEPGMVLTTAEPFIDNPSLEEVHKAIKQLQNSKAPGKNLINAKMIKAGGPKD
ncbi:Hypothetical protein CINCED_3A008817 [Cinara cedri]|uniref:Uncharacterized protein n=1 Tax=Cinara cedri TaxID=506608 RepID=A0A5E4N1P2_9HEMI|nr:Hypothetical protein CINCED_3A008817 [Cinara cedri]